MIRKWFLPILTALFSAFANADITQADGGDWTFYAPGNGFVIHDVLQSFVGVMAADGIRTLVLTCALVGLLGLMVTQMGAIRPEKILQFLFMCFFGVYFSFQLRMDLVVYDPLNNEFYTNDDVPAVVALPAVFINNVGWHLQEVVETFFSAPDSLQMTQGLPFGFVGSIVNDINSIRVREPDLATGLNNFFRDCVIPQVAAGRVTSSTIMNSDNLWGDFDNIDAIKASTVITAYPVGGVNVIATCNTAYSDLSDRLEDDADNLISSTSSNWDNNGLARMTNIIPAAFDYLSDGSATGSASEIVMANAVRNQWTDAYQSAAALVGADEVLMSMNIEQAKINQKSEWASTAEMFKEFAGYLYLILQALSFAIAPLVLIFMMLPGAGFNLLGSLMKFMFWLALWSPVLTILNSIQNAALLHDYVRAACDGCAISGISMSNSATISEFASRYVLYSNALSASVPMILWGVVNKVGFDGIGGLVGSTLAFSAANRAATNIASDSFSTKQVTMANTSIGNADYSFGTALGDTGVHQRNASGVANIQNDYGGQQNVANGAPVTKTEQASDTQQVSRQAVSSFSSSLSRTNGLSTEQSQAVSAEAAITSAIDQSQRTGKAISNTQMQQLAQNWVSETSDAILEQRGWRKGESGYEDVRTAVMADLSTHLNLGDLAGGRALAAAGAVADASSRGQQAAATANRVPTRDEFYSSLSPAEQAAFREGNMGSLVDDARHANGQRAGSSLGGKLAGLLNLISLDAGAQISSTDGSRDEMSNFNSSTSQSARKSGTSNQASASVGTQSSRDYADAVGFNSGASNRSGAATSDVVRQTLSQVNSFAEQFNHSLAATNSTASTTTFSMQTPSRPEEVRAMQQVAENRLSQVSRSTEAKVESDRHLASSSGRDLNLNKASIEDRAAQIRSSEEGRVNVGLDAMNRNRDAVDTNSVQTAPQIDSKRISAEAKSFQTSIANVLTSELGLAEQRGGTTGDLTALVGKQLDKVYEGAGSAFLTTKTISETSSAEQDYVLHSAANNGFLTEVYAFHAAPSSRQNGNGGEEYLPEDVSIITRTKNAGGKDEFYQFSGRGEMKQLTNEEVSNLESSSTGNWQKIK